MTGYRLLTARPLGEAHVVCGALRAEGLRVALQRDALGAIYGLNSGAFATRVLVHPDDYDRAAELIADVEKPPTS